MKSKEYNEREKQLYEEYENFLKTKEGQEWKEDWVNRYIDPDEKKSAGNFGDYLYDFHAEMLI